MIAGCRVPTLSYGIDKEVDVRAFDIALQKERTTFRVRYRDQEYPFQTTLIGKFNLYNSLAAIALGIVWSLPFEKMSALLATFQPPEGRLQPVPNELGIYIFVDHAHKPDALYQVLSALKALKGEGRIFTIFGCGGNRDRAKRPEMARISETLSDLTIVTNDNPRDEDPEAILAEILQGFAQLHSYLVELDRMAAIGRAIALAVPGDLIVIAGKGHETYQIFGQKTVPFDDRLVAANLCAQKKSSAFSMQ
jgi:UDP-N-acetylmuramoyl-L-alanyl-D-glutamate--2,6-diaminopimelate ligase